MSVVVLSVSAFGYIFVGMRASTMGLWVDIGYQQVIHTDPDMGQLLGAASLHIESACLDTLYQGE